MVKKGKALVERHFVCIEHDCLGEIHFQKGTMVEKEKCSDEIPHLLLSSEELHDKK